jgi:hypothetical protein
MHYFRCEFDASGRIEAVQNLVAHVLQCFQGGLFSKVVKMSPKFAAFQEASFAENGLDTQVQRDVKNFQITFRLDPAQKAEVVFYMLENIKDQKEIEEGSFLSSEVRQFEMKPVVYSVLAELHGLR